MHATVVALFALVVVAAGQLQQQPVQIARDYVLNADSTGQHSLSYAENDAARTQHLALKPSPEGYVPTIQGSYSFRAADTNKIYTVRYIADETGFHAEGDHLPVAPAIPDLPATF
ncbi:Endocuticle structural glycoprotein SgAbd-2 [Frankliniella fusca]|uniref:Endocuticle structural glycoprotein SgAbd-2 n=1 Tax=Frankliniella fusca TaxID=407009 RepID=A0AAE1LPA1_9NEOP|nr:Endocuticle structural glycoprotein SgAbd-2 [Frankliniella fusca]